VPMVLYSSTAIHSKIKTLLGQSGDGRRVAIVAYVGAGALSYVPQPKGLELICCPEPGATSHAAVNSLIARGARVRFADRLHMKVYWSNSQGCLITSANLSSSALGANGLKETGVFLPATAVDIDRLIEAAKPQRVTKEAMARLDRETKRVARRAPSRLQADKEQRDYLRWYEQVYRQAWKLGWWDMHVPAAKAAKAKAKAEYNLPEPHDYISGADGDYAAHDWILTFRVTNQIVAEFAWLFADFVVRVSRTERRVYEKTYPRHAVQVHEPGKYPRPPFTLTPSFRAAFSHVLREYGLDRFKTLKTVRPPHWLLRKTAETMR